MVVLTIVTTDNPCTVYFDEPIPKTNFVSLLSCSLYNSWLNLKRQGRISLLDSHLNVVSRGEFLVGHYTPKSIVETLDIVFKHINTKVYAALNVSWSGDIVIANPEKEVIKFDKDLVEFLNVQSIIAHGGIIIKLNAPTVLFVYCDLVDPNQNLLNEKTAPACKV